MKIYIAGASKEILLIETLRNELLRAGHTITHDWTVDVRNNAARKDYEIDKDERIEYALQDVQGVLDCDLFWLVTPETDSKGCWVELGVAIARMVGDEMSDIRVVISGHWRTIFGDLADETYATHEEALAAIEALVTR